MRRVLLLNWLMLLAFLSLSGCGRQANIETEESGREKIVLWSYFKTDAQHDALNTLITSFNFSQDLYELSWEYVPMTEFMKKLSMAYTEKSLPDLVLIDNPDMPTCIRMGMFEDITEFLQELDIEQNYYPSLLQTVTYEGRMYGIPFDCNNVALIYNRQILLDNNIRPPETWEELKETAAALTTKSRYGFLLSGLEGEQGAFQLLPWILSTGDPVDEIGGEGTKKAFSFISSFYGGWFLY